MQADISTFAGVGSKAPRLAQLPKPACFYCDDQNFTFPAWKKDPSRLRFCNEKCRDGWIRDRTNSILYSVFPEVWDYHIRYNRKTLAEYAWKMENSVSLFLYRKFPLEDFVCGTAFCSACQTPFWPAHNSRYWRYRWKGFCSKSCYDYYFAVTRTRARVSNGSKVLKAKDVPLWLAELKLTQLNIKRKVRKLCQAKT